MKTKLFTLFLAIVASVFPTFAEKVLIGDLYYNLNDTTHTAEVTSSNNFESNYDVLTTATIPSSVIYNSQNFDVTSIGSAAFYNCYGLISVTIPNSVTNIEDEAFFGCTSLTSIEIPNSVTSIGDAAFISCWGLIDIEIPNSVTSIGNGAFAYCSGLTIDIPNSVTSIGNNAFQNVLNIVYSGEATGSPWGARCINGYVEGWLVYNDDTRTNLVGCSSAATGTIAIPSSVMTIEENAFVNCTNITHVTIPTGIKCIPSYAFCGCKGITSIELPNSVTSIGKSAFELCSGLTSADIPDSVTSIGDNAFHGCYNLTSITVPQNLTSLGTGAFSGCEGIKTVVWNAKNLYDFYETSTPFYDRYYAFDLRSQITSFIFGDEVESIPAYLCSSMNQLVSVSIPASVSSIGDYAFNGCSRLTSVYISDLAAWCNITFSGYTANPFTANGSVHLYLNGEEVTNLIIPDGVTNIKNYAFDKCSSLRSVTIPNSVKDIGYSAFYGCYMTEILLGDSVTNIGDYAFYNCIRISKLEIPNSVTNIGKSAFRKCSGATNLTIGSSVVNIEDSAFFDCSRLAGDLETPNSVTRIGIGAFYNCSSLRSVSLGTSITSIESLAFYGCKGFTSIVFPSNITSIGSSAFNGCSSLVEIICSGETPASLGNQYSLPNNNTLSIYVPCGSLDAYKTAWSYYSSKIKLPYLKYAINAEINIENAGNISVPQNICEELSATANYGYHFVQWSDGNTDNPRTIELTQDTTLIAEFAYDRSGNCGNDSLLTWEYNPEEKTLFIDGDGAFVENILCGVEARPNLEKVIIGKGVTAINSTAFTNCPHLTTVEWNATNGGDCTACPFPSTVTSVVFGEDIEHIPANICKGLTGISSIVIPSSVKNIGKYAFQNINNRKISNLVLPSEIISIGDYAFAGNTYIEQIDFGKSLESIGAYAFQGCSRVMTMTCLAEVTPDVGTNALASISSDADLYVLNSALKKYQVDSNWSRFLLKPLGATGTETGGEVVVIPGDNTATFTWPTTYEAGSYTIQITKDSELICTLIFNANGQLSGIAFMPSKDNQSKSPATTLTDNGMQFTVTGLNTASKYGYRLSAEDESNRELVAYSGEFATTGFSGEVNPGGEPEYNTEGFENVDITSAPHKILRDGQVFILRGDKTYTATGQEVR